MAGQEHIQAAQTGLCMLASIKMWVSTHYGMLAVSVGTRQTYGSLCFFTSYFINIKC